MIWTKVQNVISALSDVAVSALRTARSITLLKRKNASQIVIFWDHLHDFFDPVALKAPTRLVLGQMSTIIDTVPQDRARRARRAGACPPA